MLVGPVDLPVNLPVTRPFREETIVECRKKHVMKIDIMGLDCESKRKIFRVAPDPVDVPDPIGRDAQRSARGAKR